MAARSIGARVIGTEPLDHAIDRLDRQVSVDAVMIELAGAGSLERDRLLDWANHAARAGSAAPLIALPQALVDDVYARIEESRVQLLVDPSVEQRAATLGLLLAQRREALHDHGIEADAERLRRLSEEVARIASALAELSSSARSTGYAALRDGAAVSDAPLDANAVRGLIRVRRLRDQFFSKELFADPAWDMLLDLLAARLERSRVAVSSLCIAAAVPATTALRWIRTLTEHGLFVRSADPEDGRRIFIELSDAAYDSMTAYFQTLQQVGIRLG
ncbi:MAG: MarR family transcriptional regulator [Proteobacteria bacterium]|nr:MarR family transcriptional regulator [Pseudomonadota bacterium]